MAAPTIGTGRAVEVLHYRGPAADVNQWTAGSGYLIGGRLVLTAAHNVDYRQNLGYDEQLLVRTIGGSEFAARVVLVCDELSNVDLALVEISDPRFDEHLTPVIFARVDRESPAPVPGCWAIGFPRFGEAGPVLPGGSPRETWHVWGDILPGGKLRAGLLPLQVTSTPRSSETMLAGSAWEGMSGAVTFASDPYGGECAVGVITVHHRPEGESALTLVPITAVAGLPTAERWWQHLGVADPDTLPVLPRQRWPTLDQQRSKLAGERALRDHWDPRGRGVERGNRPGWFFTGRRQALSELVAWLTAAPNLADNVRVVTGGPGSGKSAVLARLVTMSNPQYRAELPGSLAADDPVADLPPGVIDVAVHARTALTDDVVGALAAAAGAPLADLDGLIDRLVERRQTFTIAVDALDEADDPPALALTLRRLASETADVGIRLLVGTRPGGPHRRLITAMGLSNRDDEPTLIDLDIPRYLSRDDLAEYVRRRLLLTDVPPTPYRGREALAGQIAAAVADAAYPTFLIGQLVSRALLLRAEQLSPGDPGWQQFPKTVAHAMDQYLASVGNQEEQDRVEDLLRPLAYARGDGLPLDDAGLWSRLATALGRPGRGYTVADVGTLLDTAADYLTETVITGHATYYRLYHQALSDRLRERDQSRPRPFNAVQTVYQCLLDTVAPKPNGSRNWSTAHPYLNSQLAGHAADAGQLTSLLDDPGFLVAADPAGLFAALQRPGQAPTGNAQIYRHAYPHLRPGAEMAGERASYLQLAARRSGGRLADQLDQLPLQQPWTARWIRGQQPCPHYVVGRHDGSVNAVAIAVRRGRPVIISGGSGDPGDSGDEKLRVWDMQSGEPVLGPLTGHYGNVMAVAVGVRRGEPLIVSGDSSGRVKVWELESGEPVPGPAIFHPTSVNTVAVGERHGRPVIVSGSHDQTVRVWDLESGEPVLGRLTGHGDTVSAVAVGVRHGRPVIVSGGWDGTVRVWDLGTGEPVLGPLTGHGDRVSAVVVSERHDRPVIVSGGDDGAVRVWDLGTGEPLGTLAGHDGKVMAMAVGVWHGRSVIVTGGWWDKAVKVWNMETGEPLRTLTGHDGGVSAVAVGERHGRPVVISGSADRTVRVWDLESGEPVPGRSSSHEGGAWAIAVSERHGRPVIISGDTGHGRLHLWDLESGEPVPGAPTSYGIEVRAVAVGVRRGRPVIVGGNIHDGSVLVWDLQSGELVLGPLTSHLYTLGGVMTVAVGVRRGQPVIISGGWDEKVRLWGLKSGKRLKALTGHHGRVNGVAVGARHGRPVVISGGDDGTVQVWDLESGEPVLSPLIGHRGEVKAVAIGERYGQPVIISGGDDGTVRVWDLQSGEPVLSPLTGHDRAVAAVAVSEHHGHPAIVSGGWDGTVRVWDLESEHYTSFRFELEHAVYSVASTANRLVIGTSAELLRVDLL